MDPLEALRVAMASVDAYYKEYGIFQGRFGFGQSPALVVIVAVAAVITPSQDPYSLFAMAIPMYLFYEGSILVGRLLKK